MTIGAHRRILTARQVVVVGSAPDADLVVRDGPATWARIRYGTAWTVAVTPPDATLWIDGKQVEPVGSQQRLLAWFESAEPAVVEIRTDGARLQFVVQLVAQDAVTSPSPACASPSSTVPAMGPSHLSTAGAEARAGETRLIDGGLVTIGRAGGGAEVELPDVDLAAEHAAVRRRGDRVVVRDLNHGTGTFVDGQPVLRATLEPGRVFVVGHYEFRVEPNGALCWRMLPIPAPLFVSGLTVAIRRANRRGGFVVIRDITFALRGGGLLAVIGPSGAGKSTLCTALLGEATITDGQAELAGHRLPSANGLNPNLVSFVPQDSEAFGELTVGETLAYAARLRLPSDLPAAERRGQITAVLERLQLTTTAMVRISDLSGGQRRRVAIALELLTRPLLLMLDEPTSGLDEGMDRQLMTDLAAVADEGCVVVVVTHATTHLDLCTAVLALSTPPVRAGEERSPAHAGFFGTPSQLLPSFAAGSVADVMDALRIGEIGASQDTPVLHASTSSKSGSNSAGTGNPRAIPWARAFAVNVKRETLRMTRRRGSLVGLTIVGPAVAAGIAAAVNVNGFSAAPDGPNPDLGVSLSIITIFLAFLAMALSLTSLVGDLKVVQREQRWGVRPFSVVFARAVSRGVPALIQAAVASGTFVAFRGTPGHALPIVPAALGVFIVLAALTLASMAFGLLIGALVTSVEQAVGMMSAFLGVMVILSGLVIRLGNAAGSATALSLAAYVVPTRWAVAGLSAFVDAPGISALPPDALWTHDTAHFLLPVFVLVGLAAGALVAAVGILPRTIRATR
ncbi:ATP-binding cassette domain-containing protein [Amycolatopsis sp. BJA-103]|uniref:ATP-binding cassette domain-containing protein n=1 Tax=Amycolatopsis sp. BJA-103 TaxID=1911175 RepID=UPI000C7627E2|nr:ATP-binding cassette domain-containing protein [Amycolatopsis sp. BJA-103]AUI57328.1 hypothetical protein BKN51_03260 [Amycolatopsis sp. BJA-103]PNE13242.1 hypothetical protein B1H26_41355 [Amycolatopsis sp. BJA-103]